VAAECDEYGYFFQTSNTRVFDPVLNVRQADGGRQKVDIRTLPFVSFEDNEAHCQRRHGFNLGGDVAGSEDAAMAAVGPDVGHPLVIRNMKVWDVHWAFHPVSPCVLVDGLKVHDAETGLWRPVYDRHAYRNVRMTATEREEDNPRGPRPQPADFPGVLQLLTDGSGSATP
jgi:hypothetical protein